MSKKLRFCLCLSILFISLQSIAKTTEQGIRGVWVPAPRFTPVLHSYQGVKDFVKTLDELNMNSIFLVSYAETKTIYRSDVLMHYSTYKTQEESYLLSGYSKQYQSPTNDPVRDLIDEAHKHDIKVFFWFEYGFMGEGRPISPNNPLLAKNPHWLGIDNQQHPANYNQHDYYFNAYNPAVQNFLIELIEEALMLYPDLDGIQGDDRFPAMPRNSGYDTYTVSLYQSQHQGNNPPVDYNNSEWVHWRLDILNTFAKRLYKRIKAKSPNVMISFAPYRATVSEVLKYIHQNNPNQLFAPGMILMEGSNSKMSPELLQKQLRINRELGINSEIYFYNKGIDNPSVRKVLKQTYYQKIKFPEN